MDGILMAQWNVMVIIMMLYAISMYKILRYKMQNRDKFTTHIKLLPEDDNTISKERYKFIVGRVREHIFIIE